MSVQEVKDAVIRGDADAAALLTRALLDARTDPEQVLREGLIEAMRYVGEQFERGEMYVPEMLIAARAMKAALAVLKPLLVEAGTQAVGKVVIGTVQGDLHDIGKNLVSMMMEGAGFEIVDLGVDVSPDAFRAAIGPDVDIVAMSALLTTTMPQMKGVIEALVEAGLRDRVKVMVGGAPVTQSFAQEIGADGYAPDASSAARLAKQLLGLA